MTELYFQELTHTLKRNGISQPTLVLDKQRLDRNISHVIDVINRGFDFRIVAKSLPSIPLLQYIMRRTGTKKLMSFHVPFLINLAEQIPSSDVLMGKPMPVAAARHFYQWLQGNEQTDFNPQEQLQWLVDSVERLQEYQQLSDELQQTLQINLEIDVGLHRGGFNDPQQFINALKLIESSQYLQLSGLMGYEAHVTKIPAFIGGPKKAFANAMDSYQAYTRLISDTLGQDALQGLCLNAGGSSTYPMYRDTTLVNEIATASALVKPTDFDVFTLDHHTPAAFIAAPILKDVKNPELPMASGLSKVLRAIGKLPRRACFIYGGNWLAQPEYPANSKRSDILGHSSNQELYEIATDSPVKRDDFMFFRPTQSEAVFLQFGNIVVVDGDKISDRWSVFDYPQKNATDPLAAGQNTAV